MYVAITLPYLWDRGVTLPKPIVMNVRPWATSPRVCTRAEPIRAGFGSGWCTPTICRHECNFVQTVRGPATFWKLFFIFRS